MTSVSVAAGSAFRASMPERYRKVFDDAAVREHAAIAARRAGALSHVEIWKRQSSVSSQTESPKGVAILCVVAEDRPGLLAFISAALVLHGMDVVSAQAYTRRLPGGGAEAFDLLWLRRDARADHAMPPLEADVERIARALGQLMTGEVSIESAVERARPRRTPPPGASTTVKFDGDDDDALGVLTVETFDRPGLLLAITLALFQADVQILSSDAVTRDGGVVDRFTIVELDGSTIRKKRRGIVQIAVLDAVQALACGPSRHPPA